MASVLRKKIGMKLAEFIIEIWLPQIVSQFYCEIEHYRNMNSFENIQLLRNVLLMIKDPVCQMVKSSKKESFEISNCDDIEEILSYFQFVSKTFKSTSSPTIAMDIPHSPSSNWIFHGPLSIQFDQRNIFYLRQSYKNESGLIESETLTLIVQMKKNYQLIHEISSNKYEQLFKVKYSYCYNSGKIKLHLDIKFDGLSVIGCSSLIDIE